MSAAVDPLDRQLRGLFDELQHAGEPSQAVGSRILCGEAGWVRHGVRVRFNLRVAGKQVLEARYRAYGCPYTLATCEWLARRLQGCELAQVSAAGLTAAVGGATDWAASLGVPPNKLGRLLVIEDALHATVAADHSVTKGA